MALLQSDISRAVPSIARFIEGGQLHCWIVGEGGLVSSAVQAPPTHAKATMMA